MKIRVAFPACAALVALSLEGASPTPGPKPDLVVYVEDDGTVLVKNIGPADVKVPFDVVLTCRVAKGEGKACGSPLEKGTWTTRVTLKAGRPAPVKPAQGTEPVVASHPGSVCIVLPLAGWTAGEYEIEATADPTHAVDESDRTDNTARAAVTLPAKK